jgi:hypothetical protein
MKKELENLLCEYLGELMCLSDNTFDWNEKEKVLQKIDAVNLLLGTQRLEKRLSWLEKAMEAVRNIKP